ncbi:hypothetical protein H4582DRAFT_2065370 [Lactarius indigo]|nr:hypothetical protein H4582DRAFT_2065370 [Lactarius indigo]
MAVDLHGVFDESERNLGELGEETPASKTESDAGIGLDSDSEDNLRRPRKRTQKDVSAKNIALRVIKTVVCASIILKSANKDCNHLQSIVGIFVHSANVPQRAIEAPTHAGLSISIKFIQRAVKSMSNGSTHGIKGRLRSLKAAIAYDNFDTNLKTSEPTLTHRPSFVSATSATAIPLVGVEDIEVLRCFEELWKKGPRNPSPLATPAVFDEFDLVKYHLTDRHNQPSPGRDISPQQEAFAWHVQEILVNHGQYFGKPSKSLGTIDSVLAISLTRTERIPMSIEVMENLLQQGGLGGATGPGFSTGGNVDISEFVPFVHGDPLAKERLDTIRDSRRIEDTPKNWFQFAIFLLGLFHYKMACAFAGCVMRSIMNYAPPSLSAGRLEVSALGPEKWTSLEAFAESKPDWGLVAKISEEIVRKYAATMEGLSQSRTKPEAERDQQFENQTLRNRDYLLYVDLCNAMNAGDVGRVEASFLPWIYIFCATGKHKHASQLARFMKNLHEVYPPALSHLVLMNLLRNPTGKPNALRPVDWLVERNNLYTKVIYSGSGPNSNIDYICKQPPPIEVFRSCHVMVESAFQLTNRTLKHTPPDMTATIERLRAYMQSSGTCGLTRLSLFRHVFHEERGRETEERVFGSARTW